MTDINTDPTIDMFNWIKEFIPGLEKWQIEVFQWQVFMSGEFNDD